ncbi:MAG: tRNA preQ1(34) S-adenosylmethionine ribosyltransferase-isomerase QueA, partial [Candidatus Omnitrophica bacterium]|nr:tRNA preQ1(34) S-adenosylmethionine ribosyltransferase-isomerase QueA [Candidatus Omnitrophota bacterium]
MKLSDFNYDLPKELIAQYPLDERDASRMMVMERATRGIHEKRFKDIVDYLNKGDVIVFNDAKVIPAKILGNKDTGAKIELFLLEDLGDGAYKVLTKPSKRLKNGVKVLFKEGITATVLENADIGKIVKFEGSDIENKLKAIGQLPLPPYIKRPPEKSDEERYQTVYAKSSGATASPTAGLHFTDEIIKQIKNKGVNIAHVTLNVSYGTFAPVLEEEIEKHKMHKEYFKLPKETVDIVNETKKRGNKIVAVGTTATRVLETCFGDSFKLETWDTYQFKSINGTIGGWTELFIYPGYKFNVVDALLTNFHIPKSTLLMLVSAFADREFILEAYKQA